MACPKKKSHFCRARSSFPLVAPLPGSATPVCACRAFAALTLAGAGLALFPLPLPTTISFPGLCHPPPTFLRLYAALDFCTGLAPRHNQRCLRFCSINTYQSPRWTSTFPTCLTASYSALGLRDFKTEWYGSVCALDDCSLDSMSCNVPAATGLSEEVRESSRESPPAPTVLQDMDQISPPVPTFGALPCLLSTASFQTE